MSIHFVPIGAVSEKVTTWNPAKQADGEFDYIDLSAVDQSEKRIIAPNRMPTVEAPSRARQIVRAGDVLVSTVRPNLNGVAKAVDEHDGMTASTGFCVLRPSQRQLDSNYLFQWVRSPSFVGDMVRKATGASYPAVSDRIIKESVIPLPPVHEQKRIAAILDKADQLRQKRRQTIALLDSLTQSIFLEMFGDPVSNPKGWPALKISDLEVDMTYGPRFYNEQYVDDGTRIVRITDLASTGELDYSAMPRLRVTDSELTEHRSRPGDILFARTGATVGKTALIRENDPLSIPGAYFIRMRFRSNVVPEFAWATIRYPSIQKIIFEGSRQSAQQNFSGPGLRRLPFILPPIDEQLRFAQSALRAQSFGSLPKAGADRLDALFSSLQHRAFSGQL
ncbi:restriction endonuclease subunit S [Rhizobium acaciae]|uniref:restriction endonuclease subunit S n=1 Tax=Rhizobium acaciae TaxID=2989736 RepID=UPI00221FE0DB|nr:restriction endonuclease subunit S [Rhizobium acaciae]MCW1754635.1 restriction endonuclease subunit S [Rhizobium acaciae]